MYFLESFLNLQALVQAALVTSIISLLASVIFAGPFQAVAGRQAKLPMKESVGAGDEASIVPGVQI